MSSKNLHVYVIFFLIIPILRYIFPKSNDQFDWIELDSRKGRDAFVRNDKGDNDPIKLTRTKRKREQEQKEEEMVEEKEKNANNVAVYLRVLG